MGGARKAIEFEGNIWPDFPRITVTPAQAGVHAGWQLPSVSATQAIDPSLRPSVLT
jgi:hypothetical protein